jgi:hypothetical protein
MTFKYGVLGASLLAFLFANLPGGTAQTARRPVPTEGKPAYHIQVSTLLSCISVGCEHPLSGRNITLSIDGRTLPTRVKRIAEDKPGTAIPTPVHLVVAFAEGAPHRSDAEINQTLARVFSAGWLVSVQCADGTFTPYSSDGSQLERELAKGSGAAARGGEMSSIPTAIEDLKSRTGLRILVVEMPHHELAAVPDWVSQAASELNHVYEIDGGRELTLPNCVETPVGGGFRAGGGPLCSSTTSKQVREYRDGVMHELTWSKAVKHLISDRKHDYDVEVTVPASAELAGRPLTMALDDPYSFGPGTVMLDLYGSVTVNGEKLSDTRRRSTGFQLHLKSSESSM